MVASTKTHYLNVFYKGKLWGHWPISSGRPGLDTVDGTYITLEKGNPVRMVGNGYNELVNDAVRFTYSGDYLHSAPWSVGEQGITNVSHGCLNLSPQHAAMYYNLATPGDPVTVTGSPERGQVGRRLHRVVPDLEAAAARAARRARRCRSRRPAARSSARRR